MVLLQVLCAAVVANRTRCIIIKMLETKKYRLSYSPFPKHKKEKEYIIGEALLRSKEVPIDILSP